MPLKNSAEINARVAEWNKRKTELEQKIAQSKKALTDASAKFAKLDSQPATQLAEGQINIREEQPFAVDELTVRRGDMIQLIVDPNGNYGRTRRSLSGS